MICSQKKSRSFNHISSLVFATVCTMSCGIGPFKKKDSSGDTSARGLTEELGLAGNWANDCISEKGESDREFFDLSVNQITWRALAYGTENCRSGDDFRVRRSVYAVLSEVVPASLEGYRTVRVEITENSLTFKTQEVVDWANKKNYYGYADWQVNAPKDLSDRRRNPEDTTQVTVAAVRETRYLTLKVEGANMLTAEYSTGKPLPSTNTADVFKRQ